MYFLLTRTRSPSALCSLSMCSKVSRQTTVSKVLSAKGRGSISQSKRGSAGLCLSTSCASFQQVAQRVVAATNIKNSALQLVAELFVDYVVALMAVAGIVFMVGVRPQRKSASFLRDGLKSVIVVAATVVVGIGIARHESSRAFNIGISHRV